MPTYEKSLRFGLTVVLWTLIFRLFSAGILSRTAEFVTRPDVTAFLLYLETGRNVRPFLSNPQENPAFMESPPAAATIPVPKEPAPAFSPEDAETLELYNTSGKNPDLRGLLLQKTPIVPFPAPMVLILSTHTTESYQPSGENYLESAPYRTLDIQYNMVSLGNRIAAALESQGIPVLQDTDFHDYPSYNYAYSHARKSIAACLTQYPTIQIVLDLHRDAAGGNRQMRTCVNIDGEDCAQLMLVMGTDSGGLQHDNWEQNLSLALKLQVQLERTAPGITRPLSLRPQRFNQDLSPGALLVEIGAAGNTHSEALRAGDILARALAQIIKGSTS